MKRSRENVLVTCLILAVIVAWLAVLALEAWEDRRAWYERWMLDVDGNPVQVRFEGRRYPLEHLPTERGDER